MKGGIKIMNKKGQMNFGAIIMVFVAVIVTLSLFPTIVNTQNIATQKQSVAGEQFNLGTSCYGFNVSGTSNSWEVNESNSACNLTVANWYSSGDWRTLDSQCYLGSVVVANTTGTTLTSGTDYNLYSSTGIIQMLNTAETSNETLQNNLTSISYNYCGEGYNPDSGSRGVANLWSLFAALIIAGAALFGLKSWLENR
jgi:hypothetical protein